MNLNYYEDLLKHLPFGYVYHEIICEHGVPLDYQYIEIHSAFEDLTGQEKSIEQFLTTESLVSGLPN